MAERRVRVIVRGLVQGVGFRYHTKKQGTALGLKGFVRNTDSDSVEVEAEGNENAINELIAWLRTGPPHAAVESVELEEQTPTGAEHSFEIIK
jgi:acylphosphatase